jgi:hypothetical protein
VRTGVLGANADSKPVAERKGLFALNGVCSKLGVVRSGLLAIVVDSCVGGFREGLLKLGASYAGGRGKGKAF